MFCLRLTVDFRHLDEAVFAASGWPSALSDEEILERLLALNLERSTTAEILPEQSDVSASAGLQ
jgi:hypothetical protein